MSTIEILSRFWISGDDKRRTSVTLR